MLFIGKLNHPNFITLIKQIVCLLIVSEFLLTGVGFCGHTHEYVENGQKQNRLHIHFFERDFDHQTHSQSDDQSKPREEDHSEKKFRCSCQGGFIGEIDSTMYRVIFRSEILTLLEFQPYEQSWFPLVYRPPKHCTSIVSF